MERYHKKRAHSFKVSSNNPLQILSDPTTGNRRQLIKPIKKYLQDGKAERLVMKRQTLDKDCSIYGPESYPDSDQYLETSYQANREISPMRRKTKQPANDGGLFLTNQYKTKDNKIIYRRISIG